ncbi:MAG: nuclear transport factor 2 family protein [Solirubrobacterales bacterium]
MSQENVEIVRRAFERAGVEGFKETAETYWHPEVEYVEDPRWPGASTYKGREAVLRCFQAYMEALGREEDLTVSVERVFDAGDRQVPFVRVRSSASTSGLPHEHLWGYVVEVVEGRITYFRAYYEPEDALEATGLSE